jgi:hypothetical protein
LKHHCNISRIFLKKIILPASSMCSGFNDEEELENKALSHTVDVGSLGELQGSLGSNW